MMKLAGILIVVGLTIVALSSIPYFTPIIGKGYMAGYCMAAWGAITGLMFSAY